MRPGLKKALNILLIAVPIAIVIYIAFFSRELGSALDALYRLDFIWIVGLFLCWIGYTGFDCLGTWFCLRKQGYPLKLRTTLGVTLIGFYYSSITPGASGGQPMQVNSMRKSGVPVGNGTTAVTVRLIANQFVVSLLSLLFLLFNHAFVLSELGGAIWFVRVGWIINSFVVPLVFLAAVRPGLVRKLASGLIGLLARLRLVRDREALTEKAAGVLDTYHTAFHDLIRSPAQLLLQVLCSALSLLSLTGSIIFVYHAFGLSGTPWYQLLTMSLLLFVSASYTPLPGASGAQESGFIYYFRNIFLGDRYIALLIWRFFTYYLFLFIGIVPLITEKISRRRRAAAPELTEENE